jgi:hypothetical protein
MSLIDDSEILHLYSRLINESAHRLIKWAPGHDPKPTMPSLALNSGVVFAYTDSGAVPGGADYTTVVIIHGHTFHNGKPICFCSVTSISIYLV